MENQQDIDWEAVLNPPLPAFLTVNEVAKLFRVSKMTIYRMCEIGEIDNTRVGKSLRVYTDRLMETHPVTAEQIRAVVNGSVLLPHL